MQNVKSLAGLASQATPVALAMAGARDGDRLVAAGPFRLAHRVIDPGHQGIHALISSGHRHPDACRDARQAVTTASSCS